MKWVGIVLNGNEAMELEEERIESKCGCSVAVILFRIEFDTEVDDARDAFGMFGTVLGGGK